MLLTPSHRYFLSLAVFIAIIALAHQFLILPYLQTVALRAWYSRRVPTWLSTDRSVADTTLSSFIAERYVHVDPMDGRISPLKCDAYTHVFPFTDSGRPLVATFGVSDDQSWWLRQHKFLDYSDIRDLVSLEYVRQCVSSADSWQSLFRRGSGRASGIPLSSLLRYTYTVGFEEPGEKETGAGTAGTANRSSRFKENVAANGMDAQDIPTSVHESLVRSMSSDADTTPYRRLTFTFHDSVTGLSYRFQLKGYKPSPFAIAAITSASTDAALASAAPLESPSATKPITEWLPEVWLDRRLDDAAVSEATVLYTQRDSLATLFAAANSGPGSNTINPCWDQSLNKFRIGNFPVNLDEFSTIYLRGLQRVTDADAAADPTILPTLHRMYWACSYDIAKPSTSQPTAPIRARSRALAIRKKTTPKNKDGVVAKIDADSGGEKSGGDRGGDQRSSGVADSRGGDGGGGSDLKAPVKSDTQPQADGITPATPILYDTVLTLNLCIDGKSFDEKAGKCQ
jgi:uncharacterized membrane protein YgcG